MYAEQKHLAAEWRQQMERPQVVQASASAQSDDTHPDLIRVQVPKIDLDAYVVDGTSHKQLKLGPGWITTTAMPGEPGNAVISAHRDTFFRHIYELSKGDDILVRRNGRVYKFEVTGRRIVQPEDISVLKQTADAELTLITCYPIYYIGPAPERLVVFSKLVEQTPDTQTVAKQ
jgi:sortase A